MADKPKTVRGTMYNGATVETTQENADRLGGQFEAEKSKTAKKASSKSEK